MFSNTLILYGSSFWRTAATQNCRHPQGILLTSLVYPRDMPDIYIYMEYTMNIQDICYAYSIYITCI